MALKNNLFKLVPFKSWLGKQLSNRYLESPIFVVGSGRSGTTAINDCLSQHQAVKGSRNEIPLGLHLLEMIYQAADGPVYTWYQDSLAFSLPDLLSRVRRILFESVWGEHYGLRQTMGVLQGSMQQNRRYTNWTGKLFPLEHQVNQVHSIFSNARFIYVIRNGAEVVHSMGMFGAFKDISFAERCTFWAESIEKYNYLQQHSYATTVRHEDFVDDPRKEVERICEHVGIAFNSAMLVRAQSVLTHPQNAKTDLSTDVKSTLQNRDKPYSLWSADEQKLFDDICGPWMQELGYSTK